MQHPFIGPTLPKKRAQRRQNCINFPAVQAISASSGVCGRADGCMCADEAGKRSRRNLASAFFLHRHTPLSCRFHADWARNIFTRIPVTLVGVGWPRGWRGPSGPWPPPRPASSATRLPSRAAAPCFRGTFGKTTAAKARYVPHSRPPGQYIPPADVYGRVCTHGASRTLFQAVPEASTLPKKRAAPTGRPLFFLAAPVRHQAFAKRPPGIGFRGCENLTSCRPCRPCRACRRQHRRRRLLSAACRQPSLRS